MDRNASGFKRTLFLEQTAACSYRGIYIPFGPSSQPFARVSKDYDGKVVFLAEVSMVSRKQRKIKERRIRKTNLWTDLRREDSATTRWTSSLAGTGQHDIIQALRSVETSMLIAEGADQWTIIIEGSERVVSARTASHRQLSYFGILAMAERSKTWIQS